MQWRLTVWFRLETWKMVVKIFQVGRHAVIFHISKIKVYNSRYYPEWILNFTASYAFCWSLKCSLHFVHNISLLKLISPFPLNLGGFVNVVLAPGNLHKEKSYHRNWAREMCQIEDFLNETHTHFLWHMFPSLRKMELVTCVGCVYFCTIFPK